MDNWILPAVSFFILVCSYALISRSTPRRQPARLPPGPYPFPIIGNILQLGHKPHQSLANLSKTYGPLMSLKLGQLRTVVVSSPEVAKLVLQKFDQALSNRTVPDAVTVLDHLKASLVFLPVESKWRNFRKLCKEQLFSMPRLDSGEALRLKKVQELLDHVNKHSEVGEAVDIGRTTFTTTLNMLSNTLFSIDMANHDSVSSSPQDFRQIIVDIMEHAGKPNLADYFPLLKLFDPQGLRARVEIGARKEFDMFDSIMKQRLQSKALNTTSPISNDVLEALLIASMQNDAELSHNDIIHLIMDLFTAGIDTSATTVEWAMAELLNNPEKLKKAQTELREVFGNKGYQIQESDLSRLPYLLALVKETLRLHPPAPFLVPRKAETDVEINGYIIPKNAQILVNAWAMGRDPKIWSNPNSYVPDRFLESQIEFKGQHFQLIPFGAGRRLCPGLPLADRMVHLTLASLLYSFDWKLEQGVRPEDINMDEQFGFTLRKAIPLKAIPVQV